MPARYRVRLRGRTMSIWDHDEAHAVQTAHEWLDYSDKAGVDPQARATVEQIGDEPDPQDLLGTADGVPPSHPALASTYVPARPSLVERAVGRLVSWTRQWSRRR